MRVCRRERDAGQAAWGWPRERLGNGVLLDIAHRLRRLVFRTTGWRTRGVRVMAFDVRGRVLLIRHGYADRASWGFPGGGIGWRETPAEAAVREVREEVGCTLTDLEPAGVFASMAEGWRDTVHLFRARTADTPEADEWEVKEARFFALDALPVATSPATRRRLAEHRGKPIAPDW